MKKNYVRLEGNVGFAPRMTTLENDSTVIRLSIATNDRYKNRAGEFVDEAVWHNIVIWAGKNTPDFSELQKGAHLVVEGRIRPVQYTSKAGVERQTYEILASNIEVVAPKGADLPAFVELPKEAVLAEETTQLKRKKSK